MAHSPNLFKKTYMTAVLLWEVFRFVFSELRAGHTGTYGLKGYQFMLNELSRGHYSGRRRQVVEAFTLMTSIREADEKGIDMAFRLLRSDFPYEVLSTSKLEVLRSAADARNIHVVRNRAHNEIISRSPPEK